MELTKEDTNILITDDTEKEQAHKVSRKAANVELSGSSLVGGPATSASSNLLIHFLIVKLDFAETLYVEESLP